MKGNIIILIKGRNKRLQPASYLMVKYYNLFYPEIGKETLYEIISQCSKARRKKKSCHYSQLIVHRKSK